jgi:PHD/YefM family antitoxin component YafN of YafNO toxin-antitoxin module
MANSQPEYDAEQMSIAKARAMMSQLPEILSSENQAMAVTRRGKPVMAMMSWDLFESIMETMDIMGDPDLMTALRRSIEDIRADRLIPLEQVKSELLS